MIAPSRLPAFGAAVLVTAITLSACGGSGHSGATTGASNRAGSNGAGSNAAGTTPGSVTRGASRSAPGRLIVTSSAIAPDGRIQARYTCDGANVSPPLSWSAPPASAREIVVAMIDLDAPGPPFVHWALAGLAPGLRALEAGSAPATSVPGANSFGGIGYRGPCPPRGDRPHRYRFEVWALAAPLSLRRGFVLDQVRRQLSASAVARGVVQGTFAH